MKQLPRGSDTRAAVRSLAAAIRQMDTRLQELRREVAGMRRELAGDETCWDESGVSAGAGAGALRDTPRVREPLK